MCVCDRVEADTEMIVLIVSYVTAEEFYLLRPVKTVKLLCYRRLNQVHPEGHD